MQEVTFDGVVFTKASALAKEFRYTADYLGQLCRSGKVQARLVGRTWYVSRASLEVHREGRYRTQREKSRSEQDIQNKDSKTKISRLDVEPVPTRTMAKNFYEHGTSSSLRLNTSAHYLDDDAPLLPPLAQSVPVQLAEAEVVKVKSASKPNVTLLPEILPTVYMSGEVPVVAVPDEIIPPTEPGVEKTPLATAATESSLVRRPSRQTRATVVSRAPAKGSAVSSGVTPPVVQEVPIRPLEVVVSRPVAISVAVAVVLVMVMWGVDVVTIIDGASHTMWKFNFATLATLFSY